MKERQIHAIEDQNMTELKRNTLRKGEIERRTEINRWYEKTDKEMEEEEIERNRWKVEIEKE